MNVIINQATEESIRIWSRFSDIHFVKEDPEFCAHAAVGKIDFEWVGLNNLYAQVLANST